MADFIYGARDTATGKLVSDITNRMRLPVAESEKQYFSLEKKLKNM
jgi:hypothetical protein